MNFFSFSLLIISRLNFYNNMNANKKVKRLTESELHNIISESIKQVLKENNYDSDQEQASLKLRLELEEIQEINNGIQPIIDTLTTFNKMLSELYCQTPLLTKEVEQIEHASNLLYYLIVKCVRNNKQRMRKIQKHLS